MRPDISLCTSDESAVLAILDTKWKRLETPDPLASIPIDDLYQMHAYASAYGCKDICLLYPEQEYLPAGREYYLELSGLPKAQLSLYGVGLRQYSAAGIPVPSCLGRTAAADFREFRA